MELIIIIFVKRLKILPEIATSKMYRNNFEITIVNFIMIFNTWILYYFLLSHFIK